MHNDKINRFPSIVSQLTVYATFKSKRWQRWGIKR